MANEDDVTENADDQEAQDSSAETVEEEGQESALAAPAPVKPKKDLFTLLLILTFTAFLTGTALAVNELHDFYDVQFWFFTKK